MEPFNPNNEKWENYHERMEFTFQANDVKAADFATTMLALLGAETYGILKDLVTPDKPKDKNYKELIETLDKHFSLPALAR